MNVEEIRKKVRNLCEDAGLQFFFAVPNASEWAVTDCEHLRKIVSYHKELETLPPVKPVQRWIPVSERLPEKNGFHLATYDGKICVENEPFTGLAEYENGKWVYDEEDYQCVLAWMPLPKPYIAMVVNEPPVKPARKKGKWIKSNIGGAKVCSICQAHMGLSNFNYCPNCGAKMGSEEE